MKTRTIRNLCIASIVALTTITFTSKQANAQQPVAYTSVQNEVVGYDFKWKGLFGLRSEWTPVVAPVARTVVAQPAPVAVVQPVYTAQPVTVTRVPVAPVTRMAPVHPAPVVVPTSVVPATYVAPVPAVVPTTTYVRY